MSDSPTQPATVTDENQTKVTAPPSPLLRSVAIAAHVWRNHFSPMSLPLFKRKEDDASQERTTEPGVVHRNIPRVDGLWVALLVASILLWGILPMSLQHVTHPIQYTENEIVDSRKLSNLMVDPEHQVFSNLFQKLSAASQLRWKRWAKEDTDINKAQIASDLNSLLVQPSLLATDLIARKLRLDSTENEVMPDDIAQGMEPLARIVSHRQLIDQQSMGAVRDLEPSKRVAYQSNCYRLRILQALLFFLAAYRVVDIFIVGVSNSPIGLSGVTPDKRTAELNKRLILTTFLGFIELVFWHGVLLFGIELLGVGQFKESFFSNGSLATAPVHALQTSMSTITTIGYGTYGPNCWLTVALCFFETLTGIVLLTLVVSSLIGVANRDITYPMAKEILASGEKWSWIIGIPLSTSMLVFILGCVVLMVIPRIVFFQGW